jgi:hypothetical protein
MTVMLSGIGLDQENGETTPLILPDGSFDYIPIPEKTQNTREQQTFGSWTLNTAHETGLKTAAEYISDHGQLNPDPEQNKDLGTLSTYSDIASWPLHRDPNFEELTYGEHRGSGDSRKQYVKYLSGLEQGDIVAFYSGLRKPSDPTPHRHIIGYMTVKKVYSTADMSRSETQDLIQQLPENAHSKRASDDGHLDYDRYGADSKYAVLIDGMEPGGLFERNPIRISEKYTKEGNSRSSHYITNSSFLDDFKSEISAQTPIYTTRKPAIKLDISGEDFREVVGHPGNR